MRHSLCVALDHFSLFFRFSLPNYSPAAQNNTFQHAVHNHHNCELVCHVRLLSVGMDHVNEKLDEMYDKGRSLKWTIPGDEKPDTSIEFLMQQQAAAFQE